MAQINAKTEFLRATNNLIIICALISRDTHYGFDDEDITSNIILKKGYSPEDLEIFLNAIDYEYDNGYGGQELYGTIWCEDGIWLERGEYDGSEWWSVYQYPDIPEECNSNI